MDGAPTVGSQQILVDRKGEENQEYGKFLRRENEIWNGTAVSSKRLEVIDSLREEHSKSLPEGSKT
eukprot:4609819-Amphidinium_carterae.1